MTTHPEDAMTRERVLEALKEIKRIADNYEDDFEARDAIQQLADKALRSRAADRSAT